MNEFPRFEITTKGLGVFKSKSQPKVLWVGIKENPELVSMYELICEVLDKNKIKHDRKPVYKPHLTFMRIKHAKNIVVYRDLISKYTDKEIDKFMLDEVHFYESILSPNGAKYNCLEKFQLKKA